MHLFNRPSRFLLWLCGCECCVCCVCVSCIVSFSSPLMCLCSYLEGLRPFHLEPHSLYSFLSSVTVSRISFNSYFLATCAGSAFVSLPLCILYFFHLIVVEPFSMYPEVNTQRKKKVQFNALPMVSLRTQSMLWITPVCGQQLHVLRTHLLNVLICVQKFPFHLHILKLHSLQFKKHEPKSLLRVIQFSALTMQLLRT